MVEQPTPSGVGCVFRTIGVVGTGIFIAILAFGVATHSDAQSTFDTIHRNSPATPSLPGLQNTLQTALDAAPGSAHTEDSCRVDADARTPQRGIGTIWFSQDPGTANCVAMVTVTSTFTSSSAAATAAQNALNAVAAKGWTVANNQWDPADGPKPALFPFEDGVTVESAGPGKPTGKVTANDGMDGTFQVSIVVSVDLGSASCNHCR